MGIIDIDVQTEILHMKVPLKTCLSLLIIYDHITLVKLYRVLKTLGISMDKSLEILTDLKFTSY